MVATSIDPHGIVPPHKVKNPEKYRELRKRMERGGWRGRPLLAYVVPGMNKPHSLTGSHRIKAARDAGLPSVPVVMLPVTPLLHRGWRFDLDGQIYAPGYGYLRNDEELLVALAEDGAPEEAVELMTEEVEKNFEQERAG